MSLKVLSLFDGMACANIAMLQSGYKVERYVAYEIDKYAVKVAAHNFPNIEHRGDVFAADFSEFEGYDFLCGGSPCTYWSIAQHPNKRETTSSGIGWELFSQYVRALHEAKPKFFIYENNKSMSKDIRASIDAAFGFEAVLINSALVSAQNRNRLYWVGARNADGTYSKVGIRQPEDRGILLKDILDDAVAFQDKAHCLTTRCSGAIVSNTLERQQHTMCAVAVGTPQEEKAHTLKAQYAKNSALNAVIGGQTYSATMVAKPITLNLTQTCKCRTLLATYYKTGIRNILHERGKQPGIAIPVNIYSVPHGFFKGGVYEKDKANTLTATGDYPNNHKVIEHINVNPSGKGMNGTAIITDRKSRCLTTNKGEGQKVIVPVCVAQRGRYADSGNRAVKGNGKVEQYYEARTDGKTNTLTTVSKDNAVAQPIRVGVLPNSKGIAKPHQSNNIYSSEHKSTTLCANGGGQGAKTGLYAIPSLDNRKAITQRPWRVESKEPKIYQVLDGKITINEKTYPIKLEDGFYIIRKLTASECMRLQTVPEWYDFTAISNSQAYKCLGNGWTVDVIVHLIRHCS